VVKRIPYRGKYKEFHDMLQMFHNLVAGFESAMIGANAIQTEDMGLPPPSLSQEILERMEWNSIVKTNLRDEAHEVWDWFVGNQDRSKKPKLLLEMEQEVAQWDLENGGKNGVAL
jgi:hypothetical protein